MRTKTLLLTAALSAAGVATSMAQVYSVNAVGYVNKTLPPKFDLITNPLKTGGNTLEEVIPAGSTAVGQSVIYVLQPDGSYDIINAIIPDAGPPAVWESTIPAGLSGATPFPPGHGVFFENRLSTPQNLTFVGEVSQGSPISPSLPIPIGFSIRGSQVPQIGGISSVLGYPLLPTRQDVIYDLVSATGEYLVYNYGPDDAGNPGWEQIGGPPGPPGEPVIDVGNAVFIQNLTGAAKTWSRTFNVNTPP